VPGSPPTVPGVVAAVVPAVVPAAVPAVVVPAAVPVVLPEVLLAPVPAVESSSSPHPQSTTGRLDAIVSPPTTRVDLARNNRRS
jgi:hypothetical protein